MNTVNNILTALAASAFCSTALAAAAGETPVPITETVMAEYPDRAVRSEVCVSNDLDRPIYVAASWSVGDDWSSTLIGAGDAVLYRLVEDEGAPLHPQLTVQFHPYFASVLVDERLLWASPTYYPHAACHGGSRYAFTAENDGHLRDHVVLRPILYTAAPTD